MKTLKRLYKRWFVKMVRIKQAEAEAYVLNFNKTYRNT
jgi:hypothetical protein